MNNRQAEAKNNKFIEFIVVPAIILYGMFTSLTGLFVVDQAEQVLVMQFGQLKRTITKPGLYWLIPVIQTTVRYDKRVLNCDISEIELTLGDQKRIIVSVFARYFIEDPSLFYKTVQNERKAKQRLDIVIGGDLRNILGKCSLQDILSDSRNEIEHQLNKQVRESAKSMGMDMAEVKIKAMLFPSANRMSVFERMRSERLREAQEWRGKAVKVSSEIKGKADISAASIVSHANQEAQAIVGAAEARAMQIRQDVYSKDKEFADWFIRLSSYRLAFNDRVEIILGSESEYLSDILGNTGTRQSD